MRVGGNLPLKNHGKRVSIFTMCANIEPKSEPRWPNPNPDAQILAIKEMFQTNFQNTIKINGSSAQDLAKKLKPNKIKKSSKNIQKLSQHASWNYDFSQEPPPERPRNETASIKARSPRDEASTRNASGNSALHHAARKGLTGVVFCILSHPEYRESWVEAVCDGSNLSAIDLAVAAGYHHLAADMNAYLDERQQRTSAREMHSKCATPPAASATETPYCAEHCCNDTNRSLGTSDV